MITTETYLYQIFSNAFDWSKRITSLNIPQLKLENIRVILPNFQERACYEKRLIIICFLRKYAADSSQGNALGKLLASRNR